ncbi:MAG: YraN family protein [Bacteroidales bacterium]|nr:YraN family protein [Bacteroidales bacterium]
MSESYQLGKNGEEMAADYLRSLGYRIEAQRWRLHHLELDIIATDRESDEIVFVEVKTRTTPIFGAPEEAVDYRKIMNTVRAADAYLKQYQIMKDWRFDIIAIIDDGKHEPKLRHFKEAFYPPLG